MRDYVRSSNGPTQIEKLDDDPVSRNQSIRTIKKLEKITVIVHKRFAVSDPRAIFVLFPIYRFTTK